MSAVTGKRGRINVNLNGVTLPLKYEAENMMELSRLTGVNPIEFIERIRKDGADPRAAGLRASDLNVLVPLISAGLCHLDEYAPLSDVQMRRKVCGLIDGESMRATKSLLQVTAEIVADVLPVFIGTLEAPGREVDEPSAEKEELAPPLGGEHSASAGTG